MHLLQDNQTGVENKHFKKEQYVTSLSLPVCDSTSLPRRLIEALTDPKTWLFFLFAAIS